MFTSIYSASNQPLTLYGLLQTGQPLSRSVHDPLHSGYPPAQAWPDHPSISHLILGLGTSLLESFPYILWLGPARLVHKSI